MTADTQASDSQIQPVTDAKASSAGHGSAAAKNDKRRNQKILSVVVTLDEAARIERLARERGKSVLAYLKERGLRALHYQSQLCGFIRTQLVRPNHSGMAILFHGLLEKSPCGSLILLFDDEALQELSGRCMSEDR